MIIKQSFFSEKNENVVFDLPILWQKMWRVECDIKVKKLPMLIQKSKLNKV